MLELIQVEIDKLNEAEYNPRKISKKDYQNLKDSILKFGMVDPIIVNSNENRKNVVIGGHQRLKVWKELKKTHIPCVFVNLDIQSEKELNIRLNKNLGEFDFELLELEFDIDDLKDWGFEDKDFQVELDEPNSLKPENAKNVNLDPVFQVIISCENESDQKVTFEKLHDLGYKCRLLSL